MYCIVALPRTASTYLWNLINSSCYLQHPKYKSNIIDEPFNPKYNLTLEQQKQLANSFFPEIYPPVVKILTSHSYDIFFEFLNTSYTMVFLKPRIVKDNMLKNILMKYSSIYFGDRKIEREELVKTIDVTSEEIITMLQHYKKHMELEVLCNHTFFDADVITQPRMVIESMNLEYCKKINYRWKPPYYSDYELLIDKEKFHHDYEKASIKIFGEVI